MKIQRREYTPDEVRQAAQHYAVVGNIKRVSRTTGIPDTTLHHWKKNRQEWQESVATVRVEKDAAVRAGLRHNIGDKVKVFGVLGFGVAIVIDH